MSGAERQHLTLRLGEYKAAVDKASIAGLGPPPTGQSAAAKALLAVWQLQVTALKAAFAAENNRIISIPPDYRELRMRDALGRRPGACQPRPQGRRQVRGWGAT